MGKETSQSSTFETGSSSRAVDGNIDSKYTNNSCSHTDKQKTPSWWCVKLKSTEQFKSIMLYNRDILKDRLKGFSVKVSKSGGCDQSTFESSQVCYKDESTELKDIYTVDSCKEGQYVFITTPRSYLTLCEVKIFQGFELNLTPNINYVMHGKWGDAPNEASKISSAQYNGTL
ncbi:hypothetical protein LOTGIDRAFT_153689 [Lottia gigantea]|uniref:Fucolectin tachylectin-4 pentraxin-1 domain-containing protein n=1 Tax=Lottia gigantea TaxID=225164 RepID=V4BQS7_LOTGI|nr:hypothetical protein LOTGIDRAFT_153689 [Lottia gigantea]ESO91259.1 hypothetical protein LOTGIDRAFT_153689 [Lottia gigantea]